MFWLRIAAISLAITLSACGGGGGGGSDGNPVPPVVSLDVSPGAIQAGTSATLNWDSTDTTDCTASGGWSGSRAGSGSESTGVLASTTSYTLTCNGPGGSDTRSATVTVTALPPAPVVTLSATPSTIASGAASTLNWNATNATSCTASGGWSGIKATSGSQSTGSLGSTTSFTLTCTGAGGTGNQSVSVAVIPPPPVVTLTASPQTIDSGQAATLTWTSANAATCTASGSWNGSRATSGSQSTGVLTGNATYTLSCSGPGGSAAQTAVITVNPAAGTPTVNLAANPSNVNFGNASTLTWSTTNATACSASGGWSGSRGTSGSESTGGLSANTSYSLTCTGPGGSANQAISVTVTPPAPTVTLSASPTSLASGASSTLTWSTTDATSCTASGGWSGPKATSGTVSTGAVTATTTYSLTCTGAGGSANQSATVTVNPAPTVTLSASPTSLASGASSTLTWSTTNATSCTASGGWSGTKATSGTGSTGAVTATTTYTLTCTGSGGSASQSATVTVNPAPTVTLSANPTSLASGASSTLTWSTTNATSCTASGGWSGTKATSGTASTAAVTATTTYTLTCAGPGGSGSDSATVIVTGSSSLFPVRVESNKRYLIDAQGTPFLIHGDTPWCLITQLTREQVDQYLEDRRVKGFNTIMVELIEKQYSTNPPFNVYGDAPFTTAGDFSTPNAAYFDHAAYVIAKAREKGMLVLLTPAYLGFGGGPDGWYDELGASSTAVLEGYGQYVATRFQDYDNILWVHGGDYNPADRGPMRDIINGILSVETTRLHTFHGSRGTAALEWLGPSETWLDVNDIYTTTETVIAEAQGEFDRSTMPYFLIEAGYENESATGTQTRQQAWQAVLSGATGQLMGQQSIWKFDPIWPTRLNTEGASTLIHLRTLLESYAWWTLVPDFGNTFLTGGFGTAGLRAPAAVASDGSFALVYVREVRQLTVDMGAIAGSLVQARWYDPTNGSFTAVSGSPFASSGSRNFTPTGTNALGKTDWVLVLDSIP